MYNYVKDKKFLKRAQNACSETIKALELSLRKNYKINTQFFLVGSGGRNMITQNENGPIDFDYNLNIISCKDINDCKEIKEAIKKAFNNILHSKKLPDCDDSKSSLTTKKRHFQDQRDIEFSIDLCIVMKDSKNIWNRLIHKKTGNTNNDEYIWNQAPNSNNIKEKIHDIKVANEWHSLRETYLKKKNFYLQNNNFDHPSFNCYIEAVNEVYCKLKKLK